MRTFSVRFNRLRYGFKVVASRIEINHCRNSEYSSSGAKLIKNIFSITMVGFQSGHVYFLTGPYNFPISFQNEIESFRGETVQKVLLIQTKGNGLSADWYRSN